MVSVMGRVFPCVYALLPNKTKTTYNRLFLQLFNVVNGNANNPNDILVDFENTGIKALRGQKPGIEVKGCFFHLCSNIWKHIQNLGLSIHYKNDEEFALHLRMMFDVAELWSFVVLFEMSIMMKSTNYLSISGIPRLDDIHRTHRHVLRYLQSMFGTCTIGQTTNYLEQTIAWKDCTVHLQGHISSCHPNFWKFINVLKREEGLVRV